MLFQKTTAKKNPQNSFCLLIWLQIIHQQFVPTCKHPPCDLCSGTVGRPTGPSTSMGPHFGSTVGQPLVWAPHTKQRVAAYPQYTYILGVDSPTPIVPGTHVQHGTLLPPVGCSVHQNVNWKRKVTSSSQSNQIGDLADF